MQILTLGNLTLAFFLLDGAVVQDSIKAGLWEVTSNMIWQHPPSITDKSSGIPDSVGVHKDKVCLSRDDIDKYGAIPPPSPGQCKVENVKRSPQSISADMICEGGMRGTGTIETSWVDSKHAKGKVHFVGSMLVRAGETSVEWTSVSKSQFLSSDCKAAKSTTETK